MSLPEITNLEYEVWEWLDDRMPYNDNHNPSITFHVKVEGMQWLGFILSDFLNYEDNIQNILKSENLGLANDQPGIERITEGYWVMWDLLDGRRWGDLEPVFRISHRYFMSILENLDRIRREVLRD